MSGPWISDRSAEEENPTIPLGFNSMAIPRAALTASVVTIGVLLLSSLWVGYGAYVFLAQLDDSFSTVDASELKRDGRWEWEVTSLYESCSAREEGWAWPEILADRPGPFWFAGELACVWEHQGVGDQMVVVVHNINSESIDFVVNISSPDIVLADSSNQPFTVAGNSTGLFALELQQDVDALTFTVELAPVALPEAIVELELVVSKDSEERPLHTENGDSCQVHYKVWNADTDELLDEGDLPVTAGDDSRYITGFGWSAIGLDVGSDRGFVFDTGTTHTTLLPPELAYNDADADDEVRGRWLRFELKLNQMNSI